jgi:hydroxymethylglutaryl-CoA reductase
MNIDDIKTICVIGAGNMGHQISVHLALFGFNTVCTDISSDALRKAQEFAHSYLKGRVAKGKLTNIENYAVGKLLFLRFNYTTGDAAGQNMVSKATFAACEWIRSKYPAIRHYNLSGNLDTDKKSSFINWYPRRFWQTVMKRSGESSWTGQTRTAAPSPSGIP